MHLGLRAVPRAKCEPTFTTLEDKVQTTIVPVVIMLRVEDLTNIDDAEKATLIALFDELKLPHVISQTHLVISSVSTS